MNAHQKNLASDTLMRLSESMQPTFTSLSSHLSLGQPAADLSTGWDGTLWSIDQSGTPYLWDPLTNSWNVYGTGIDAMCLWKNIPLVLKGEQALYATQLTALTKLWPDLPVSFALGVHGAATCKNGLYLISHGQYLRVGSNQKPRELASLHHWPQSPRWSSGVIDTVGSGNGVDSQVALIRDREVLIVDFGQEAVVWGPVPLRSGFGGRVLSLLEEGRVDSLFYTGSVTSANAPVQLFAGPVVWEATGSKDAAPKSSYLGGIAKWPQFWNPLLAHSPSGRLGNLWAAMSGGRRGVVWHDGSHWTAIDGVAAYASVGVDDSVFTVGYESALYRWLGGERFDRLAPSPAPLKQLSVASQSSIWALDVNNRAYSYNSRERSFTLSGHIKNAVHLSASYDGTVWHCKSDQNAYRFGGATEEGTEAIKVDEKAQTKIQKIAGSRWGASYCLSQSQSGSKIHSYQSGFAMKTAPSLQLLGKRMEHGLDTLFFSDRVRVDISIPYQSYVVAIDAQTGQELWRTIASPSKNVANTDPVFDPMQQCVYLGSAPENAEDATSQGWLIALDARTGKILWASSSPSPSSASKMIYGIDQRPVLNGSHLYVIDRQAFVHMFDVSKPNTPASWTVRPPVGALCRAGEPTLWNERLYWWTWSQEGHEFAYRIWSCWAEDGSDLKEIGQRLLTGISKIEQVVLWGPLIIAEMPLASGGTGPAVFLQTIRGIYGYSLVSDPVSDQRKFELPPGVQFASLLGAGDGTLWASDTKLQLWGFDSKLSLLPKTPVAIVKDGSIAPESAMESAMPAPIVYQDEAEKVTVFVATGNMLIAAFGPATGIVVEVKTVGTWTRSLCSDIIDGLLYVGGYHPGNNSGGQVFGIRVDSLISGTHDIVLESQLLQDYDFPGGGTGTAVPKARYQTHLTILDAQRAPRPQQAVKIWADQPNTRLSIGGKSYQVGPTENSCVRAQTGLNGALTILSDAEDLSATPLRIWASFMEHHERVVVYPDREFQLRLLTAHADPTDQNPDRLNLSTATSYDDKPLFTEKEKQTKQAEQVASAIRAMGEASGIRAEPNGSALYSAVSAPSRYTPYSDLVGQVYFPLNTSAERMAHPTGATGLIFSGEFSEFSALNVVSPGFAASAIDRLEGDSWSPVAVQNGSRVAPASIFKDFWNWLKKKIAEAVATITDIIVSIAEDIYIGIRVLVNGIAQVFRAIVRTVADIASAIGSLFLKIGKIIKNIVEALSVFLNWDRVRKTQDEIKNLITNFLQTAPADVASALPTIESWFRTAKNDLKAEISKFCGDPVNQQSVIQNKKDPNPHASFAVPGKASHSVENMYLMNKASENLELTELKFMSYSPEEFSPISDLMERVEETLRNLGHDFEKVGDEMVKVFKSTSAEEVFRNLLNVFLRLVNVVIEIALSTAEALTITILKAFGEACSAFREMLEFVIDIPFLSRLWRTVISPGNELTMLDLASLIFSLPVTIMHYALTGEYPFAASFTADAGAAWDAKTLQVVTGVGFVFQAIFMAISDAATGLAFITKKVVSSFVAFFQMITGIGGFQIAFKDGQLDRSKEWRIALASTGLLPFVLNLIGIRLLPKEPSPKQILLKEVLPVVVSMVGLTRFGLVVTDWVKTKPSTLPGIANQVGNLISVGPLVARPITLFLKTNAEPISNTIMRGLLLYIDAIGWGGKGIIMLADVAFELPAAEVLALA